MGILGRRGFGGDGGSLTGSALVKPILRTTNAQGAAPTALEYPAPPVDAAAEIILSDGVKEYYAFVAGSWQFRGRYVPSAGPQGPVGPASVIPGPVGPASTVPGPVGPPGAASTIPGPQGIPGAASIVPGPAGPTGATGLTGSIGQVVWTTTPIPLALNTTTFGNTNSSTVSTGFFTPPVPTRAGDWFVLADGASDAETNLMRVRFDGSGTNRLLDQLGPAVIEITANDVKVTFIWVGSLVTGWWAYTF